MHTSIIDFYGFLQADVSYILTLPAPCTKLSLQEKEVRKI